MRILLLGAAILFSGAWVVSTPFEAEATITDYSVSDTITIVRPGAPGEGQRTDAVPAPSVSYSEADVAFMQDMILHHAQAIEMTDMVPTRSSHQELRQLAYRIRLGQADEIRQMMHWLEVRGESVPPLPEAARAFLGLDEESHEMHDGQMHHVDSEHHADEHHEYHHEEMLGMLSPEQLEELRNASGTKFDQLFLEYMIFHHEGAIFMVDALFDSDSAAQGSGLYSLAAHVEIDQTMEIRRMQRMLSQLD